MLLVEQIRVTIPIHQFRLESQLQPVGIGKGEDPFEGGVKRRVTGVADHADTT